MEVPQPEAAVVSKDDTILDILNPYHRIQEECRKKLAKYGILNPNNLKLEVWKLAKVRIARTQQQLEELLTINPILARSRVIKSEQEQEAEENMVNEMMDTNNLDMVSPDEDENFIFG